MSSLQGGVFNQDVGASFSATGRGGSAALSGGMAAAWTQFITHGMTGRDESRPYGSFFAMTDRGTVSIDTERALLVRMASKIGSKKSSVTARSARRSTSFTFFSASSWLTNRFRSERETTFLSS